MDLNRGFLSGLHPDGCFGHFAVAQHGATAKQGMGLSERYGRESESWEGEDESHGARLPASIVKNL